MIPGLDIDNIEFWNKFSEAANDLSVVNANLIKKREAIQNKIDDWKSTEESFLTQYSYSAGGLDTLYETTGVKWLTERIEVDPEFDGVGFALLGNVESKTRDEHLWFGDDMSGVQTITSNETSVKYQLGWKDYLLDIKGSHTQAGANISNELGDAHSISSNTQGMYSLAINGADAIQVNSDEWLNGILLDTGIDF